MNEDINFAVRFDDDELAWRAFRYLHGELTADEAEAFEEDLAVEQPSREALAQAVELTAALEAAGGVVRTPSQFVATRQPSSGKQTRATPWLHRWSRRQVLTGAGVIGTAIAACLAVVVTLGLMGRWGRNDTGDPRPTDPGDAQAALAEAWVGIFGDDWHDVVLHDVAATMPIPFSPDGDVADEDRLHGDHEAELSVPSVPSWLLAALDPQPDESPEIEDIKEIKQ